MAFPEMPNIFLLDIDFKKKNQGNISVKIGHRLTVSPNTNTSDTQGTYDFESILYSHRGN